MKGQNYIKANLVRFIDSMRLMNASLDNHVNNLKNKGCKKCKDCKDDAVEWCKKCKKLSDYLKNAKKYMRTVIVILNTKK